MADSLMRRRFLQASVLGLPAVLGMHRLGVLDLEFARGSSELKTPGEIPVSGKKTKDVELLDAVMLKFMEPTQSTAATLAVSIKGEIVHSRGYGWIDKHRLLPTQPNSLIGIASCDKPIIVALIRLLARLRMIDLNASFFETLKMRPKGKIVDARVKKIKIAHLIEDKAGWGSSPEVEAYAAAIKAGLKPPIPTEDLLGFVMTQKLKDNPGEEFVHCNYGFNWCRFLAEKKTGKPFDESFRSLLFKPMKHEEILATGWRDARLGEDRPLKAMKNETKLSLVWNAEEGGPTCASAPYLCHFMSKYWITGEPRNEGNPLWISYGSLPGSTAMMVQRSDGVDFAAIFNKRGQATHDAIREELGKNLSKMFKAVNSEK